MKKQTLVFAIITVMIIGIVPAMLAIPPEIPPIRLPWTGPTLAIGGNPSSDYEDIPFFFYPNGDDMPVQVDIQLSGTISNAGGQQCKGEVQQEGYSYFLQGPGSGSYVIHNETNTTDGWYGLSWNATYNHGNAYMSMSIEEE